MGLRAIIYYMTTTVCAVMLGIALVTTIKPGNDPEAATSMNTTKLVMKDTLTSDTLLDLVRSVICIVIQIISACMSCKYLLWVWVMWYCCLTLLETS